MVEGVLLVGLGRGIRYLMNRPLGLEIYWKLIAICVELDLIGDDEILDESSEGWQVEKYR